MFWVGNGSKTNAIQSIDGVLTILPSIAYNLCRYNIQYVYYVLYSIIDYTWSRFGESFRGKMQYNVYIIYINLLTSVLTSYYFWWKSVNQKWKRWRLRRCGRYLSDCLGEGLGGEKNNTWPEIGCWQMTREIRIRWVCKFLKTQYFSLYSSRHKPALS